MRAWDVNDQDKAARQSGTDLMPRQEYYNALRDALHAELVRDGRSDWLDAILSQIALGQREDLYLLDFAALMACHGLIVRGQPLRDTSRFVPYARSTNGDKLAWADMRPTAAYRMRITPEVTSSLHELHEAAARLQTQQEDAVIPPEETVAQRKFEQAQALNRRLEQQNAELIAERDDLRRQLRELQEGYISDQLHCAAEARRHQLEAELAAQYADQKRAATEVFRQQYQQELRTLETRRAQAAHPDPHERQAVTDAYRAVRADLQRSLADFQAELARQAETWQQGLFRAETRMLASSYTSLAGLLRGGMAQVMAEARLQSAPEPLVAQLLRLQDECRARLAQLEQAMLRLGLEVIDPAAGTAYDPALHTPTGAVTGSMPGPGATVRLCVKPGVRMLREAGKADEVLFLAEVDVSGKA